jgi:hypothetical protein
MLSDLKYLLISVEFSFKDAVNEKEYALVIFKSQASGAISYNNVNDLKVK